MGLSQIERMTCVERIEGLAPGPGRPSKLQREQVRMVLLRGTTCGTGRESTYKYK